MRMLNRIRSAGAAADIEARAIRARSAIARRFLLVPLMVASIAAASNALTLPAQANNGPVGSMSVGSSMGGGHIASGARQFGASRSILFTHRSQLHRGDFRRFKDFDRARGFRHFHHRDRDVFAGDFFPFGFWGWPWPQTDVAANTDALSGEETDWRSSLFRAWLDRYQPPTVEKSPSGVTIIRGPGSHHGF